MNWVKIVESLKDGLVIVREAGEELPELEEMLRWAELRINSPHPPTPYPLAGEGEIRDVQ